MDGGFIITLFKDNISTDQLHKLGLSARQVKAVLFVKENGKITNNDYQSINEVSDRTALRDIEELVDRGILVKQGQKKGTIYKLRFGG